LGVVAEIFFAKSAGRCFTPLIEIKHTASVFVETSTHTHSLSEEGFGYNYGRLKSSASHASRENTLLTCGKIRKRVRRLQRASDIEGRGLLSQVYAVLRVSIYSLSIA